MLTASTILSELKQFIPGHWNKMEMPQTDNVIVDMSLNLTGIDGVYMWHFTQCDYYRHVNGNG